MTVKDLETLYDYGYWANKKLFQVISRLTPDQFTQTIGGSFESVRNTLVHILSAEWGWLDRCGGPKRGPRLDPAAYPTLESVMEAWNKVEGWVREFLSSLKDEDLTRKVEFSIEEGKKNCMPLGELMQHSANHAVHHRGQVALMIRTLGHSPGYIDLVLYYAEIHGAPSP